MTHPNVVPILEVSPAHLTKADADLLSSDKVPTWVVAHEHGWFIYVETDPAIVALTEQDARWREVGFSPNAVSLLALARRHGCRWLSLYRDANPIPDLPVYDW